jgi:hypothetical protein
MMLRPEVEDGLLDEALVKMVKDGLLDVALAEVKEGLRAKWENWPWEKSL